MVTQSSDCHPIGRKKSPVRVIERGQEVRVRSSLYACAFPVRPVRALKAVLFLLEDSLYGDDHPK